MNLANNIIKHIFLTGMFSIIGTLYSMDDEKSASKTSSSGNSTNIQSSSEVKKLQQIVATAHLYDYEDETTSANDKKSSMSFTWPRFANNSSSNATCNSLNKPSSTTHSDQLASNNEIPLITMADDQNNSDNKPNEENKQIVYSKSKQKKIFQIINDALNIQSDVSYDQFIALLEIIGKDYSSHLFSEKEYDNFLRDMGTLALVLEQKKMQDLQEARDQQKLRPGSIIMFYLCEWSSIEEGLRRARYQSLGYSELFENFDLIKNLSEHVTPMEGYKSDATHSISLIIKGQPIAAHIGGQRCVLAQKEKQNGFKTLKLLLDNGAEVDEGTAGFSLLSKAISNNKIHLACLLANYGADVNNFERDRSPLSVAINTGNPKSLQFLIAHNVDPNYMQNHIINPHGPQPPSTTIPIMACANLDPTKHHEHIAKITAMLMLAGAYLPSRKAVEIAAVIARKSGNDSNLIILQSPTLTIQTLLQEEKEHDDIFMDKETAQKLRKDIKDGKLAKRVDPESDNYSVKDMIKDRFKTQVRSKQDLLFKAQKQSEQDGRKHKKKVQSEQNIFRKLSQRQLGNLTQKSSRFDESGNQIPEITHNPAGSYIACNKKTRKANMETL